MVRFDFFNLLGFSLDFFPEKKKKGNATFMNQMYI